MNRNEVCKQWATQAKPRGRASNVYYEGTVIFSYGSHFPLAGILADGMVLVQSRDWGTASTRCHLSSVRGAVAQYLSDRKVFHVPLPSGWRPLQDGLTAEMYDAALCHYRDTADWLNGKYVKARTNRGYYNGKIADNHKEWEAFGKYGGQFVNTKKLAVVMA